MTMEHCAKLTCDVCGIVSERKNGGMPDDWRFVKVHGNDNDKVRAVGVVPEVNAHVCSVCVEKLPEPLRALPLSYV